MPSRNRLRGEGGLEVSVAFKLGGVMCAGAAIAALIVFPAILESAPQEPAPHDLEKARRLLEVEMQSIRDALAAYRNEQVVSRTGAERRAGEQSWWRLRRSHTQVAASMADAELDVEGAMRLLARAREIDEDLRQLRGIESPDRSAVVDALVEPNDDCGSAQLVGEGTFFADTTMATDDGDSSCGFETGDDVWYSFTASSDGDVIFDTLGSDFDTVLSLHTACPGTPANELACNDDYRGMTSRVVHSMVSGETVLIRAAGYRGRSGSLVVGIGRPGAIDGTVVEALTGDPIAFGRITLWRGQDVEDTTVTNAAGHYGFSVVPPGSYTVEAPSSTPHLGELYDDIDCYDFTCDPTTGTAVVVSAAATTSGIDFVLDRGGSVQGTVTGEVGGAPLENVAVDVFDASGGWRAWGFTDASGDYTTESALPDGLYTAATDGFDRFFGELFDELPCPSFCDVTLGTPIAVSENVETGGVDFTLLESGAISGSVRDAVSGFPIRGNVIVYDAYGSIQTTAFASNAGNYITHEPLPAGSYTALADGFDNYLLEIFSGIYCGVPCDVTSGMPILVSNGTVTSGIDFNLVRSAGVEGKVTDAETGLGIEGLLVWLLTANGDVVGSDFTDPTGHYFANRDLGPGTYYAMTSSFDYFDEVYEDVACESVLCATSFGTPIAVSLAELRSGIDFELEKPSATCNQPRRLTLTGDVSADTYEAFSSIFVGGATFYGAAVLRARDVVSLGNGTTLAGGASLTVEQYAFVGCPATTP